jgi:hypothetical protein
MAGKEKILYTVSEDAGDEEPLTEGKSKEHLSTFGLRLFTEEAKPVIEKFISDNCLDQGNADVWIDSKGRISVTFEAPFHSAICLDFDFGDIEITERALMLAFIKGAIDFTADAEFDEIWSSDFGNHNGFTPSAFLRMLQEDEAFFLETAIRFINQLDS